MIYMGKYKVFRYFFFFTYSRDKFECVKSGFDASGK